VTFLAKHFALIAAHYLPSWEIIDYAGAAKIDAPSGTTRELAEELATIDGTQVHSIRLPGYVIAFETIFGLPDERLSFSSGISRRTSPCC